MAMNGGASQKKLADLLMLAFLATFLLFLFSTPAFYLMISRDIAGETGLFVELMARGFRFLLAGVLCWGVRRTNREVLIGYKAQRQKMMWVILGCVAAWALLCISGGKIYYGVSQSIGIYSRQRTPLFLAVLWEQIFGADFPLGLLLGFGVVVFPMAEKPLRAAEK